MDPHQELLFRATVAEKAKRYQEVVDAMNHIAMLDMELTLQERDLFSLGYKKVTAEKRASIKALMYFEVKEEGKGNESRMKMAIEFRQKVEAELDNLCNNVINTIDKHLLPYSSDAESKAFYYQMKGDYYRYLAEFKIQSEYSEVNASNIAEINLSPAHPVRLGLALNVSVFYHDLLDSSDRALQLAKQAIEDAVPNLWLLDGDSYNQSSMILQLMGNNLALWNLNSNMDVEAEDTQEGTKMSGTPSDSNMDVDAENTLECIGKSGAAGNSAECDEDAK
ncbi:hypothetical protein EJB05_52416 [Eragrostis curvula]|uniref:14-3-3 domain-containing protein n=1 Tax=Eragrostis curvula TaxID=38414 RepID=A0A5J9SSW9_9POAL|nr:hypothetical protein EJB05_52416 [Eragrostis curvula]